MSTIMSTVGTIFSAIIGWVSTVATTVTASGNELLLLFVLIPVAFLGINMFRKLLNL